MPSDRACFAELGHGVGIDGAVHLCEYGDKGGPPSLVAGAEAGTVVTVEVLMERNAIAPVEVALEFLRSAEHRTPPNLIAKEDALQTIGDFLADIEEGPARAS